MIIGGAPRIIAFNLMYEFFFIKLRLYVGQHSFYHSVILSSFYYYRLVRQWTKCLIALPLPSRRSETVTTVNLYCCCRVWSLDWT